jgi:hypothetical protein
MGDMSELYDYDLDYDDELYEAEWCDLCDDFLSDCEHGKGAKP